MSKTLSFSIPDELHKTYLEHKDKIKISQICQDALSKAIKYKTMKYETKDIESLKERLIKEKIMTASHYKELGFKHGAKDAYSLKLEDFLRLENEPDFKQLKYEEEGFSDPHDLINCFNASKDSTTYIGEFFRKITLMKDRYIGEPSEEIIEMTMELDWQYAEGWIDGVQSVWQQVRDDLNLLEF
jgi:hypothetical protein